MQIHERTEILIVGKSQKPNGKKPNGNEFLRNFAWVFFVVVLILALHSMIYGNQLKKRAIGEVFDNPDELILNLIKMEVDQSEWIQSWIFVSCDTPIKISRDKFNLKINNCKVREEDLGFDDNYICDGEFNGDVEGLFDKDYLLKEFNLTCREI